MSRLPQLDSLIVEEANLHVEIARQFFKSALAYARKKDARKKEKP